MLAQCSSICICLLLLLASLIEPAPCHGDAEKQQALSNQIVYSVDADQAKLNRSTIYDQQRATTIGEIKTRQGKTLKQVSNLIQLPGHSSLFGFHFDMHARQSRLIHIDKATGEAVYVGSPLGTGRITGAAMLALVENDEGRLVMPTPDMKLTSNFASHQPTPVDVAQRMRLFVIQSIDEGPKQTLKTFAPYTAWTIEPRTGEVKHGTVREDAGIAQWDSEGKLEGITGGCRIDAFTFDKEGNLWLFNDDITSRLYRVDHKQFDKDPATPLEAIYIGNTNLRSRDQLTNMRFINNNLFAIGNASKRIYQISTTDAKIEEFGSLNKIGAFEVGGFVVGADQKVYLTKTQKYARSTTVYRVTNFPVGELEEVCKLDGAGDVVALTAHPDGSLLAAAENNWYHIDPAKGAVKKTAASKLSKDSRVDYFYAAEHEFIHPPAAQAARLLHVNHSNGNTAVLLKLGRAYQSFAITPDGKFFATSGKELFLIDPLSRRETLISSLAIQNITSMHYADGQLWVYDSKAGVAHQCLENGTLTGKTVALHKQGTKAVTMVRMADDATQFASVMD